MLCFFFSSRRRHTRFKCDWSSDVCSSDLEKCHRLSPALLYDHTQHPPIKTAATSRGVLEDRCEIDRRVADGAAMLPERSGPLPPSIPTDTIDLTAVLSGATLVVTTSTSLIFRLLLVA